MFSTFLRREVHSLSWPSAGSGQAVSHLARTVVICSLHLANLNTNIIWWQLSTSFMHGKGLTFYRKCLLVGGWKFHVNSEMGQSVLCYKYFYLHYKKFVNWVYFMLHKHLTIKTDILICFHHVLLIHFFFFFPPIPPNARAAALAAAVSWMAMAM